VRHRSWKPALARASIAGVTVGVTVLALSVPAMAAAPTTPNGCSNTTPAANNPNCPPATTGGTGGAGGNAGANNGGGASNAAGGNSTNNPPGNNGTVKIHDVGTNGAADSDPANQPHVGCTFIVDFFGFDSSQTNLPFDIMGQAPTTGGVVYTGNALLKATPAGGSQDQDGTVTLTASELNLAQLGSPQPQQGYHLKLTVYTNQPGLNGVKHKVFWVQCTPGSGQAQSATPVAPSVTQSVCTSGNTPTVPTYTIQSTAGVVYEINRAAVAAGTYPNATGVPVTVTAVPAMGYTFTPVSWTLTFTPALCNQGGNTNLPLSATPTAPSVTPAACTSGTTPTIATYTIPNIPGVVYEINGRMVAAGTYQHASGAPVTVTATPALGYVFPSATIATWTLHFPAATCHTGSGGGSTPGGITTPVVTPPVVHPQTTPPSGTQVSPVKVVTSTPGTQVLGEKFTRSVTPQVAAAQATTLPFTGASNTGALLTSGLGALLGGALLMIAGRKRRTA